MNITAEKILSELMNDLSPRARDSFHVDNATDYLGSFEAAMKFVNLDHYCEAMEVLGINQSSFSPCVSWLG
jgi:hypothetical protein